MPIYMRLEGIDGSVQAGGAAGGVWKTTNFLTSDRARSASGSPGVGVLRSQDGGSTWAANAIPVSRISLTPGDGGVEGRDAAAKLKVAQLINAVRRQVPGGKLYVATDAGVYSSINNQGKLIVGVDDGIWRSGGANKFNGSNNLKQLGLAAHNSATVEIIVTDACGTVVSSHRLSNAAVSRLSGTFTLTFKGQTTSG